jgi:inorganic phosphate transporter, PiT family
VDLMLLPIIAAVCFLAYTNGANDNFKGVATLFGSGSCTYRQALAWATVTTLGGSLLAVYFAGALVASFQGKGLVPDEVTRDPAFLLAVSLGAALTVLLATWTGMPVSTSHALTGSLVGAGLLASGGDVRLAPLGMSFALPLLFSPIAALLGTAILYPLFRWCRSRAAVDSCLCVCIGTVNEAVVAQPDGSILLARTGTALTIAQTAECRQRYTGAVLGMDAARLLDILHYVSGGAVGFARGLNDTPKIVALLLAADALPASMGSMFVAITIAVGGLLNARRVAETMSRKIVQMSPGQGFTANLVTSLLVAGASRLGLPVSTTHVSVGGLFGIGVVNRTARFRTVLAILLAWVTTLPLGAALAAGVYLLLKACSVEG